jgi:hypothetical protein
MIFKNLVSTSKWTHFSVLIFITETDYKCHNEINKKTVSEINKSELLNQLADLHKTWYKWYAIVGQFGAIIFNFLQWVIPCQRCRLVKLEWHCYHVLESPEMAYYNGSRNNMQVLVKYSVSLLLYPFLKRKGEYKVINILTYFVWNTGFVLTVTRMAMVQNFEVIVQQI